MTKRWSEQARTAGTLRAGAALMVVLALACPQLASAKLGEGLKVGPGRLKLGVEGEARFDSNAGVGAFGVLGGGARTDPSDVVGRLRGNLALDVPGQSVKLTLTGSVDWNQYLGLVVNTSALSFFGANAALGLNFNPNGGVGFEVTNGFSRSDRSANPVIAAGAIGLSNDLKGRLRFRPGGGAIEGGLSYQFVADVFSSQAGILDGASFSGICATNVACNPDLLPAYNALTHRFGADLKWRFLPKTGATLEGTFGMRTYPTTVVKDTDGNTVMSNVPSSPLRVLLGAGTLLSTRLSINLKAGYSALFFDDVGGVSTATVHGFIAQGELGYRLTETLQLRGGYIRNFDPVGGSSKYFKSNRLFVDFQAQFSKLVVGAQAGVDLVDMELTPALGSSNVAASGRIDYNLTDWLRVGGGLSYTARFSNTSETPGTQGDIVSSFSYNRFEASAGVATLF